MTIRHTSAALLVLGILLSLSPSTHAQDFDDSISGPRRQLSVTAGFNGDTMFKQPVRGVSQTNGETPCADHRLRLGDQRLRLCHAPARTASAEGSDREWIYRPGALWKCSRRWTTP